MISLGRLRPPD